MEKSERMQAEWECIKLSHAFAYYLDQRNYVDLATLFTPDGIWVRHGLPLRGRAEIIAAMEKRSANQFTRHVTTGFHFTFMDDTDAKSVSYNASYFSLDADVLPARYTSEHFMLLDFIDEYKKTAEGWRFSERITKEVLVSDTIRAILAAHH